MFFVAVGVDLLFIYLSCVSVCEMIYVLMILIVLDESEDGLCSFWSLRNDWICFFVFFCYASHMPFLV